MASNIFFCASHLCKIVKATYFHLSFLLNIILFILKLCLSNYKVKKKLPKMRYPVLKYFYFFFCGRGRVHVHYFLFSLHFLFRNKVRVLSCLTPCNVIIYFEMCLSNFKTNLIFFYFNYVLLLITFSRDSISIITEL